MEDIVPDPDNFKRRWLSYLDLLGMKSRIRGEAWENVFSGLGQAIEDAREKSDFWDGIEAVWFSDTFLFYAPDDSAESFAKIEQVTRLFIESSLNIGSLQPLCGAMSCDEFYADKENDLFFGKALVEAHEYGENQDWVGLVLCPSAVKRMEEIGLPADERLNYVYANISWKTDRFPDELPALRMGCSTVINEKNQCLEKLKEMRNHLKRINTDMKILRKYDNTIAFLEKNRIFRNIS